MKWLLRIAAWVVVAAPLLRLALEPSRVWMDGRLMQVHIATEQHHAAGELLRALGDDRLWEGGFSDRMEVRANGFLSPATLELGPEPNRPDETILLVMSDGRAAWPPFRPQLVAGGGPNLHHNGRTFQASDGREIPVILVWQYGDNAEELRIWFLLDGSWHNVLRVGGLYLWLNRLEEFDQEPVWNPENAAFEIHVTLPKQVQRLPALQPADWRHPRIAG